ncbi:MAG: heme exporter protein CcmD [Bosea sp. (in: a-proteobacteria)]
MLNLGPHSAFILGSYLACVAVITALSAWIVLDYRARRRELAALDARRSQDSRP